MNDYAQQIGNGILLLLAVCVLAALLYLVSIVTFFIFGYGLGSFFSEIIELIIVSLVLGFLLYAPGHALTENEAQRERWFVIVTLIVLVWVVVPHTIMSIGLRNVKKEFYGNTPTLEMLQKRDNILNSWGFIGFPGWGRSEGYFDNTGSVYLFVGVRGLNHPRVIYQTNDE